jgi:hypothetical protein
VDSSTFIKKYQHNDRTLAPESGQHIERTTEDSGSDRTLHILLHLTRRYSYYSSVDSWLTEDRTLNSKRPDAGVQHQVNISKGPKSDFSNRTCPVDTERTLVSIRSTSTATSDSSVHCGQNELTGAFDQEDLRV